MSSSPYAPYDYAWKDRGWTVQNPEVVYPINTYLDPGLPSDVSLVRVFGHFQELDSGRGLEGVLRLRTTQNLLHVPTGVQFPASDLRPIRFQADGFSIFLAATDDPDLTPTFTYQARLTVLGNHTDFEFALPSTPSSVNILSLIPVS